MAKDKDLLERFGANLAESMGAGRPPRSQAGSIVPASPSSGKHDGVSRLKSAAEIEVSRIAPDPDQPRTEFDPDAIERLANSLKTHGQIQPISVRWSESMGRYLLVTGERRWRASMLANRPTISAVIIEGERTDSQILEMQLVENCLREDLQPIEQARAFRTLMDRNGWPAAKLAEVLQLTGASVTRALSLLDLPYTVQDAVASGELAPSVAYEVSKIDDPATQVQVAARVVAEKLSRAETVEAVRQVARSTSLGGEKGRGVAKSSSKGSKSKPKKLPTERIIRTSLGPRITIEYRKGLDDGIIIQSLREALAKIEGQAVESSDQAEDHAAA